MSSGLHFECPGTTTVSLSSTLRLITTPIQSLSIYDFDRAVATLPADIFAAGMVVHRLQFKHSHLQSLSEQSVRSLRGSLESLSIVNGKLEQVGSCVFGWVRRTGAKRQVIACCAVMCVCAAIDVKVKQLLHY